MAIRRLILIWLVDGATDAQRHDALSVLREALVPHAAGVELGLKRDPRAGFDLCAALRFDSEAAVEQFDRAAGDAARRALGAQLGGLKQYDFEVQA